MQGTVDDTYEYLDKDSFLLVIMTAFQAQMFEMFSHKVMCIDSTHKTNPYGFKLITIVVPDEFKNGYYICTLHTNFDHYHSYPCARVFQLPGPLLIEKM